MSEEPHSLDDPVRKARVVRALLWMTPVAFVLCYVLAAVQGAEAKHSLLIAVVGAGMSLSAAFVINLMGSKSWIALVMLKVALMLVAKK